MTPQSSRLLLASLACVWLLVMQAQSQDSKPRPGVTLENFRRLQKGMTSEEVEAVLGKGEFCFRFTGSYTMSWAAKPAYVFIEFSEQGDKAINGNFQERGKILERLRPRKKP